MVRCVVHCSGFEPEQGVEEKVKEVVFVGNQSVASSALKRSLGGKVHSFCPLWIFYYHILSSGRMLRLRDHDMADRSCDGGVVVFPYYLDIPSPRPVSLFRPISGRLPSFDVSLSYETEPTNCEI